MRTFTIGQGLSADSNVSEVKIALTPDGFEFIAGKSVFTINEDTLITTLNAMARGEAHG